MTLKGFERPGLTDPVPRIVMSGPDRILHRTISDLDDELGWNEWISSKSFGIFNIKNIIEPYRNIHLIHNITEDGEHQIYRTTDLINHELVYEHDAPIYGLFQFGDHKTMFSAENGWFETLDTGRNWSLFSSGLPASKRAISLRYVDENLDNQMRIILYGEDHILYYAYYYCPDDWDEAYDTNAVWGGQWYPALDGGPMGLLAGAGDKLLISETHGESWAIKSQVNGIIEQISISNKLINPSFLIVIHQQGSEESKLYWTHDLADSPLIPDINRLVPGIQVRSVYPMGMSDSESLFVVNSKQKTAMGNLHDRYDVIVKSN